MKVLIGERGFYHQTQPGNGRYFRYSEILKAWESAGKESNGTTGYFCTCETIDGQVLRFPFLPGESDGIGYFLDCVNSRTGGEASRVPQDDGREYTIDGKTNGLAAMIICLALAVFFSVLAADQLQPQPNKYIAAAFGFGGIAGCVSCVADPAVHPLFLLSGAHWNYRLFFSLPSVKRAILFLLRYQKLPGGT